MKQNEYLNTIIQVEDMDHEKRKAKLESLNRAK